MTTPKIDAYGTHLPLLVACVAATGGPVLELGCGLYSTPVLHALCSTSRKLISAETDSAWAARFSQYQTGRHSIIVYKDPLASIDLSDRWSVALVDQAPASSRAPAVDRLRGKADLIVCHDSEHRLYDYERVLVGFKHRIEWRRYAPWTTVVSDTMNLDFLKDLL